MKNLTWQNPEQQKVAQVLIKKVKLKCCGIWDNNKYKNNYEQERISKTHYASGRDSRGKHYLYPVRGINSNAGLTLGEKSNNQPAARRPSRNIWDGGDDWDE
ncbi:MAG: hypothetical protein IJ901_01755 [Bacteroidaceae bacterium]|nr:hypothetical protein [Bacteroidaceae bacterium]